jgi:hypothetical protein
MHNWILLEFFDKPMKRQEATPNWWVVDEEKLLESCFTKLWTFGPYTSNRKTGHA